MQCPVKLNTFCCSDPKRWMHTRISIPATFTEMALHTENSCMMEKPLLSAVRPEFIDDNISYSPRGRHRVNQSPIIIFDNNSFRTRTSQLKLNGKDFARWGKQFVLSQVPYSRRCANSHLTCSHWHECINHIRSRESVSVRRWDEKRVAHARKHLHEKFKRKTQHAIDGCMTTKEKEQRQLH